MMRAALQGIITIKDNIRQKIKKSPSTVVKLRSQVRLLKTITTICDGNSENS